MQKRKKLKHLKTTWSINCTLQHA